MAGTASMVTARAILVMRRTGFIAIGMPIALDALALLHFAHAIRARTFNGIGSTHGFIPRSFF
ncbi:Hypothetical protein GbCGDNIH9_0676 [Granulibacter bethesdensis]|uniref:Uncharacterized protein n=1 Tax=Granulibacter bethesdensis TaxID=364410 RepID=A0AAC9K9A6_9PROT|nr:Hypothetical protein GbCGDNIH9_0676 [Granulibacter bethesdensis]APH61504.1 Hypothetical protein GbCGDNIH8_0676 [Granulibacter bethesdensis]